MPTTTFLSPDSLANLPLILISVVPGLIIAWIRSQFLTGRITSRSAALTYYVAVSFIYNAITYPFVFDLISQDQFNKCSWFIAIILIPLIVGLISGLEAQNEWIYNLLRKFNLNIVHPIETPWDYKFKNIDKNGEWVLITLKNGKKFGGFFDKNSVASSDLTKRELYIKYIYKINEGDKPWTLKPRTSVLIDTEEVLKIEFQGQPSSQGASK